MNTFRARRLIVPLFAAIGVMAGLVVAPTTPASAAGVHVAPTSIDATGKTDVTGALVSFFESVPDGATIAFPAGSRYRVEGVMVFEDRQSLTIDGAGATFVVTTDGTSAAEGKDHEWWGRLWPRKRGQFIFNGGSDLTIRNLSIVGPNAGAGAHNDSYVSSLEAQHGVEFFNTKDSVLEDCTIRNTYGDLVSVSGRSTDIVVRNCTLTHSGRQGVTVDRAQKVRIENNRISEIGRSAIDLEPAHADWTVDDVTIVGNHVGLANGVFVAAYGIGPVDNVTVRDNVLTGEELMILVKESKGRMRKNWTVTGNATDKRAGSPVAPLRFTNVDNIVISGNRQPVASTQSRLAVSIDNATSVGIHGNAFPIVDTRDQTKPETGETAGIVINGAVHVQPVAMGAPTPTTPQSTPTIADGGGRFVSQIYSDFLQRDPTGAELSAWTASALTDSGRHQLAEKLAYSDEWVGALVDGFYRDTLDRDADPSGRAHWLEVIRRGKMTPTQVAAAFYASQEYFDTKGSSSHARWVEQLYLALLQRTPDAAGHSHWITVGEQNGRQVVTSAFYDSTETLRARIEGLYQALLGRSADPSGLGHWSDVVRRSGSDIELAIRLASSKEYVARSAG